MAGRSHLSIGEVLSLLQEEFPDVTISKIRFLESQGLVDPERTPSGYRKFYEEDIERLRWVLRQQRDAFLPLKVIKGRLEGQGTLALEVPPAEHPEPEAQAGSQGRTARQSGQASLPSGSGNGRPRHEAAPSEAASATAGVGGPVPVASTRGGRAARGAGPGPEGELPPGPAPAPLAGSAEQSGTTGGHRRQAASTGRRDRSLGGRGATVRAAGERRVDGRGTTGGGDEEDLGLEELVSTSGVDLDTVRDLERYGLIAPRLVAGTPYYSREAAEIAGLAAAFARHGVEARHLRAYKGAAEREAGMVQQVVLPLIRQRNPEARRAASRAVEELSDLGAQLRAVLLKGALADLR